MGETQWHTCIHMQNEQSMILKLGSCSLGPEALYIIQLMGFFAAFMKKVVFNFQHFYICFGETAKGGCFGPKQAFLKRTIS